jgi:acyl carrier protein
MEEKIIQSIIDIVRRIRPEAEEALRANELLTELLDSFDIVMLVQEFESTFGVMIDGERIVPENFCSLGALTDLIKGCGK